MITDQAGTAGHLHGATCRVDTEGPNVWWLCGKVGANECGAVIANFTSDPAGGVRCRRVAAESGEQCSHHLPGGSR